MRPCALLLLLFALPATAFAANEDRCLAHAIPFTDSGKAATPQYNRARPMDVKHIRLDLRVDVEGERLDGTATHTFTAIGAPLQQVTFDAAGLDIAKVELGDGRAVDFEATQDQLRVYLPTPVQPGEDAVLRISYGVHRPEKGMHFRTPRMGYHGDDVQCWSQGESEDARYWFPCYDAPNERATTEIAATVPNGFRAASNGELIGATDNAQDGTHTFHYRLDKDHASYLVSLAVGHFVEIRDDSAPVPLFYYVAPGQEEKAQLSFGKTGDMMRFFEQTLGVPYPWGRYSQVAVVDFIAGGMENTSITTLTERSVQDAPARLTNRSEHLVSHELAHQWFGDLVTCRDWTNIWLNEGWASYMEVCYTGHDEGPEAYDQRLWECARDVFNVDKPENRLATVRKAWGDPEGLFDARVYEKGAWILHMLRRELGDEIFWKAVRTYLERNAHTPVETNQFMRVLEEVSGRGLEQFFDQWVYHAGWPDFRVSYDWDEARKLAKVHVEQTQKTDDKTLLFQVRTALRFVGEGYSQDAAIEISEREHTIYTALPARPTFVRFDPDGSVLKSLDFDKPKDMLKAQLAQDKTVWGRYEAVAGLGKLHDDDSVAALTKALNDDAFWGVRARAIEALAGMDNTKAEDAIVAALQQTDARVRLSAAKALSKAQTEAARDALAERVNGDESPYVSAAAIDSLAQQLSAYHAETIAGALKRDSQNQVVRNAALGALGRLQIEDALAVLTPYTTMDAPRMSRAAAIAAIGAAGQYLAEKTDYRQTLVALLDAPNAYLRRATADALGTLGDPQAVPALDAFALAAKTDQEARAGRDNAAKLRDRNTPPQALQQLQDQLDQLKKDLGTLREEKKNTDERLDAVETKQSAEKKDAGDKKGKS